MKKLIIFLLSFGAIATFASENSSYYQMKQGRAMLKGRYNNGKLIGPNGIIIEHSKNNESYNTYSIRDNLSLHCDVNYNQRASRAIFNTDNQIFRVNEVPKANLLEKLSLNKKYIISAIEINMVVTCNYPASIDQMLYNLGIISQKIETFDHFDLYSKARKIFLDDVEEELNLNFASYLKAYYEMREATAEEGNRYFLNTEDDVVQSTWFNKLSPSQKSLVWEIEISTKYKTRSV